MVFVAGAKVLLGGVAGEPTRHATIASFCIDRTEVTVASFTAWKSDGGACPREPDG
jgi:formylglycine-generating enzyme required for sulfatase activity